MRRELGIGGKITPTNTVRRKIVKAKISKVQPKLPPEVDKYFTKPKFVRGGPHTPGFWPITAELLQNPEAFKVLAQAGFEVAIVSKAYR
jgi:hypothetical protein